MTSNQDAEEAIQQLIGRHRSVDGRYRVVLAVLMAYDRKVLPPVMVDVLNHVFPLYESMVWYDAMVALDNMLKTGEFKAEELTDAAKKLMERIKREMGALDKILEPISQCLTPELKEQHKVN
jgi:hypothetical protein